METELQQNKPVALIMDDNEFMRRALKRMLRADFEVLLAPNPEEALSSLEKAEVVLSAWRPNLDSFQKFLDTVNGKPMLVMTTFPERVPAKWPTVQKPFLCQELLEPLHLAVRNKELQFTQTMKCPNCDEESLHKVRNDFWVCSSCEYTDQR